MDKELIVRRVSDEFDSYELFFLKEKTRRFESRDRDLHSVEINEEEGVALRVIKERKMVFSYTFERGQMAAGALIEKAKMLVPFVDADDEVILPRPSAGYPSLHLFDERGLRTGDDEKVSRLVAMESAMLDYDKRIVATRNCELQEDEIEIEIINSQGLHVSGKKTLYSVSALSVAREKDEVSWYDWTWAHSFESLDLKALGVRVSEKAMSFLGSEQIPTGSYEGILSPRASCEILSILSGSFLGESLYKNKTRLKDKLGQKCFSEKVSVIDSGMSGMGASPFDGEGVPSQDSVLVEKGVFKTFLYDTYYGKRFNHPSTGNATRSGVKDPPVCGRRGLFIEPGVSHVPYSTMKGLVIEELMGTHTANPITGDFSLGAVGHLMEGQRKIPFKGVIFSGNIFELLNSVQAVGTDLTFYGTCGSPSLAVSGMKISGK